MFTYLSFFKFPNKVTTSNTGSVVKNEILNKNIKTSSSPKKKRRGVKRTVFKKQSCVSKAKPITDFYYGIKMLKTFVETHKSLPTTREIELKKFWDKQITHYCHSNSLKYKIYKDSKAMAAFESLLTKVSPITKKKYVKYDDNWSAEDAQSNISKSATKMSSTPQLTHGPSLANGNIPKSHEKYIWNPKNN